MFHEIHDLQEYSLSLAQLAGVVLYDKIEDHEDVETALREAVEAYLAGSFFHQRMIDDELLDAGDDLFHLFTRRVVHDLNKKALATLGPYAEVLDRRVHHHAARDCHQRVVRRSDAGAAETDILHGAFGPADPDDVADAERLLDRNEQ